jgi:hypothetical protein
MSEHDPDDLATEPNTAAEPYGFHVHGFRFMCWPAEDDDESDADERELTNETTGDPGVFHRDVKLGRDAAAAASTMSALEPDMEYRWRSIPANGGAGDNFIVDLVQVVGGGLGSILALLQLPKASKQAWDVLRELFGRMTDSGQRDDWHAGSEVGILKCIALIREEVEDAEIVPEAIRVVQDGTQTPMWGDMAAGMHVIVIPEMKHQRTHIFVIDSKLEIHGRMVVPRLTVDAECLR